MAVNMKVATTLAVIFGIIYLTSVEGRFKRCYNCRSRGDLGDCKDPFELNATMVEDVKGVEALPCASGWCAKIIEGENSDYDTATERMCVQRPPADGEERCSDTVIDRKPVYMCFCHGDLCNAGKNLQSTHYLILLAMTMMAFLFAKCTAV
ncbi:UPAR/Ly6 domain-containing protein rtv [Parasteatoda tepidariorum]|uniref:UPAR/Ly6 domain-containing protein rtv n=1 Tax=Parasteatoda tepidariorum TaxID=114398 RepID=UPI00077FC0C9|nr:protein quiver [Parasteatoda tepidariorum]